MTFLNYTYKSSSVNIKIFILAVNSNTFANIGQDLWTVADCEVSDPLTCYRPMCTFADIFTYRV